MFIISETFINLYRRSLYFFDMSMMLGCYCLRITKVQIRFLFDNSFVSYFFMKSYMGTHFNHLFDKILICNPQQHFL